MCCAGLRKLESLQVVCVDDNDPACVWNRQFFLVVVVLSVFGLSVGSSVVRAKEGLLMIFHVDSFQNEEFENRHWKTERQTNLVWSRQTRTETRATGGGCSCSPS